MAEEDLSKMDASDSKQEDVKAKVSSKQEDVKAKVSSKEEDVKAKMSKAKDAASVDDEEEVSEKTDNEESTEKDDKSIDVAAAEDEKELKRRVIREKDRRKGQKPSDFEEEKIEWLPRTSLGKKVKSGMISKMGEVMGQQAPIKEVEIVDTLLPELNEEVLDVGRVQRVTDSGRRMRFRVITAVGNNDGYVGVGQAKGKEAGPTIRKSIERAKLNIVEIKRACGSWECGCGEPHTVPYKVSGKCGSVKVILKPAPKGVGIVSGKLAKTLLSLAGIKDVWVKTEGHTRTGVNFAQAVLNALEATNYMKISDDESKKLNVVSGATLKNPEPEAVEGSDE